MKENTKIDKVVMTGILNKVFSSGTVHKDNYEEEGYKISINHKGADTKYSKRTLVSVKFKRDMEEVDVNFIIRILKTRVIPDKPEVKRIEPVKKQKKLKILIEDSNKDLTPTVE